MNRHVEHDAATQRHHGHKGQAHQPRQGELVREAPGPYSLSPNPIPKLQTVSHLCEEFQPVKPLTGPSVKLPSSNWRS
ncbi:hypothetical protein GCM10007094_04050 [Pseudovibrio japonicus]|uniref:Uncharacterized protein n=1 Tax=Pseudovibrio japonicus TaxID=366534 RepID=A0ABQ3E077_9HYPH|nr:hypothetical protein GCM10007094_04050 [Pseudovibrio japonicus]